MIQVSKMAAQSRATVLDGTEAFIAKLASKTSPFMSPLTSKR